MTRTEETGDRDSDKTSMEEEVPGGQLKRKMGLRQLQSLYTEAETRRRHEWTHNWRA